VQVKGLQETMMGRKWKEYRSSESSVPPRFKGFGFQFWQSLAISAILAISS
jgi:hypothetical protein